MIPQLRDYQADAEAGIYQAWADGARNVLAVLPTGAGKTVLFAKTLDDFQGRALAIAHRQELVGQISTALGERGVRHRIFAPNDVIKNIVRKHMDELGRSYFEPNANTAVAGVDTLLARRTQLGPWLAGVGLWVQDEAHHILRENKWGKAAALMPGAHGLGVTATPIRADGRGLGRHADGIVDNMIVGPCGRDLIDRGYLAEYRIIRPPSDLNVSAVPIGSTGDYTRPGLRVAVQRSSIMGDIVTHYQRHAAGLRGITFVTDTDTGAEVASRYRDAGIPAEFISHKTPGHVRDTLIRRFRSGDLLQLVNIDLFGEGFDVPAVQVVSFGRPTQSYAVYSQQFGRALRPPGPAIILDHAGNSIRHGLPDMPRPWTLDRREKRARGLGSDVIPVRVCPQCEHVYERIHRLCPYCGFYPVPAARNGPDQVDGDLEELDAATLAEMRAAVRAVDATTGEERARLAAARVPLIGQAAGVNRHAARQEAQRGLRAAIALWAGYQRHAGRPDSESYRRFYHRFGIDVLSAQALGTAEAAELAGRIDTTIGGM